MPIPFWMMPSSWGLKGKSRAIAEAEYSLRGIDLDLTLNDIENLNLSEPKRHPLTRLAILHRHGRISTHEFETETAKIELSGDELIRKLAKIEFNHNHITRYEYDTRMAELAGDATQVAETKLGVDLEHGKLTKQEHDKQLATLKNEPWVSPLMIESEGDGGFNISVDWNDVFLRQLRDAGYGSSFDSDDDIIQMWVRRLCEDLTHELETR